MAAPNFLNPGSVEYVMPSDVQVSLVFFVPITTGSTYNRKQLVERDNSLPSGPAGRCRTTRWSVVLLSAQVAAEGRLEP